MVATVTLLEAGKALFFAAAFGLLFFVPVAMFLFPWALAQDRVCRAAAMGLVALVGLAAITVFSWVTRWLA